MVTVANQDQIGMKMELFKVVQNFSETQMACLLRQFVGNKTLLRRSRFDEYTTVHNCQNACVARITIIELFNKMLGMLLVCFTLIFQMPQGCNNFFDTNRVVFYILQFSFSILDFRDSVSSNIEISKRLRSPR